MLCFSVDSPDSLENVESKWVGEIAENCAGGVRLVLVALKCDLREGGGEGAEDEGGEGKEEGDGGEDGEGGEGRRRRGMIDYKRGLEVAKRIQALRYLGACLCGCEALCPFFHAFFSSIFSFAIDRARVVTVATPRLFQFMISVLFEVGLPKLS